MREALYYQMVGEIAHCQLCPRACQISEGQRSFCRSRKLINGKLIAVSYANTVSISKDPIEKKPLYQFHPHSQIISLGPNSCNLSCAFCQNWEISQQDTITQAIKISELAAYVRKLRPCQIAFTYTEPTMWYEFIWDFAVFAPDVEIVLVTNGYLNPLPWQALLPKIKAMNIDLKSIRNGFYKRLCGGDVEIVKANIAAAHKAGVHLELTNLLIPGENDTEAELHELAEFVASIDPNIPLHISAYRPCYKMTQRATSNAEIEAACEIAAKHLKYVYAGNVLSTRFGRHQQT